MTKGGSGKPKTLGRLIFGEKRKQHASPSRHRSSTRNDNSTQDLPSSNGIPASKNAINLHDWAIWRMQLNEQMGSGMGERRSDLKHMRQFLQSNPFYQQHSRDRSNGRSNGVRLLFSIPHAKLKPEFLNESQGGINKIATITTTTNNNNHAHNELEDTVVYDQKKIRSNSDDRTTTSINSISAVQPMIVDKTISHLVPKGLMGNTSGFRHVNEQMIAADGIQTRRSVRSSFTTSDRIHSTLQKAVKDGNVLEKIKAFEMQAAAAAQAESITKLGGINHRIQPIQSIAHRTLSPPTIHPIHNTISPMTIQEQSIHSNRNHHHIHSGQQRYDGGSHALIHGHESRKGAHFLEPAHGDIILKRRTPSQKTIDEDYSITAISSMALTNSQAQRGGNHHHHHHRTSASRSRHRQEMTHGKRTPSNHENLLHKQKGSITPSAKSSTRRRWLKGRKEIPVENIPIQNNKQEISTTKSNKNHKKKTSEQEKIDRKKLSKSDKEKLTSDNNRVYGVPNTNLNEQIKIEEECQSNHIDKKNIYIPLKGEDINQMKESEIKIQQRTNKKHHQQKLSSTDGEILNKIKENPSQFSHSKDNHAQHSDHNDNDDDGDQSGADDVFIEDVPMKPIPNLTRHQSIVNHPNNQSRRFQQTSSNTLRRHASQCSADEFKSERINSNTLKKKSSPLTLITRKNKINQDEQIVYEAPLSEQTQAPICNTHTLKKKRPFHTINTIGSSTNTTHNPTNKQISKQILHAIMNSMNNNQEQIIIPSQASPSSVNDEFFENGPLTNPEETLTNVTTSN
ncbi:unnamed protein product [Adineta steineri]|uniref:Uncharacterized protein n=1 Tax=Adineta steineri TaxID=433720 RepID=A0A818UC81_9BILA|nr:unnamed protein product [Adineta steineri]